jgi:hypothetical protein
MKEGDRVRILNGVREGQSATILVVLSPIESRPYPLYVLADTMDTGNRMVYQEEEIEPYVVDRSR